MSDPARALIEAMRLRLIGHAPLTALLGGAHVFDELPRGEPLPHIVFSACETRDWSVKDQKAHEHFVTLEAKTGARSRKLAQALVAEIDAALDSYPLALSGQLLVNLSLLFWTVTKDRASGGFSAVIRFRAATEPQ